MSDILKKAFFRALRYRFNLEEDKAQEEDIKATIRRAVEFRGTNLWALIFAIFVASIGLNVNSTAVVIGAMLISPLMGPIMGVGLGAAIFDFALIRYSLKNLLVAAFIAIATSAIYFWLTPLKTAQSEVLARTSPTIWDVLIALFGGLAGIVASSRKDKSNTVAGVAIATALMPPLCTAGYGIGTGNLYYFLGAFYLFLINSVFIAIATFVIIRFLKFKPVEFIDAPTETKLRRTVWVIATVTILPSVVLAYFFVKQEIFKQNLSRFEREVIEPGNYYVINEKVWPAQRRVSWLIYSEKPLDSLHRLIAGAKSAYDLDEAEFDIHQTLSTIKPQMEPLRLPNESSKLAEKQAALLLEKDRAIAQLQDELASERQRDTNVYREFFALFGNVQSLSIEKSLLQTEAGRRDSVLLVYIRNGKRLNIDQITRWFRARYTRDSIVVAFDTRQPGRR